jgi:hydroxymethylpyrimidine/phosphomethylpyrimidine kinase
MHERNPYPRAMTIAGSDSGAGAGIQADLKVFAALGVYGTSAVTAITAQNTLGVTAVHELPPTLVIDQIDAIVSDIGVDVVKTGMLSNSTMIETVSNKIIEYNLKNLVVDPVMVAKGGDRLLREDAVDSLRIHLIPLALVVTPNLPEAAVIVGRNIETVSDSKYAARQIVDNMGAKNVVIKGGHLTGSPIDIFYDGQNIREMYSPRINTMSTHGTGCTFASAIAAYLARGNNPEKASLKAKRYVTHSLIRSFPLGGGHGPLNHFYRHWKVINKGQE